MGKFADILPLVLEGNRARDPARVTMLDGKTELVCDLRILMPEDDAEIERGAKEYARAKGEKEPRPGNEQYERGLMLHAVARACVDADAKERFEPFFASVAEVEKHLEDGRVARLFFQQRAFQRKVSPNPERDQRPEDFLRLAIESYVAEEAGGDPALPFVDLPRGTLIVSLVHAVRMLFAQPPTSSPSGSEKPTSGASSSSSAQN